MDTALNNDKNNSSLIKHIRNQIQLSIPFSKKKNQQYKRKKNQQYNSMQLLLKVDVFQKKKSTIQTQKKSTIQFYAVVVESR
jgi:hypothetical protein